MSGAAVHSSPRLSCARSEQARTAALRHVFVCTGPVLLRLGWIHLMAQADAAAAHVSPHPHVFNCGHSIWRALPTLGLFKLPWRETWSVALPALKTFSAHHCVQYAVEQVAGSKFRVCFGALPTQVAVM
ncbi:hypothetical protein P3T76_003796 [Phytophthora citrophthora]|uniref:Uncharacterized protein n=1 Tax=Phytophthora citrophthora TaxID=4793 RepID=A0AAD9LPT7_9STRA|nr:hypothetical protein P3T76_003796 [Phytophthora citrophthora]